MGTILLNALVAVGAVVVILGVWIGVHLIAQRRVGERKLGCSGPVPSKDGVAMCCSENRPCKEVQAECPADDALPRPD